MSHDDLRAEYERLKEQVARLLQQKPQVETETPEPDSCWKNFRH